MRGLISGLAVFLAFLYKMPKRNQAPVLDSEIVCPVCKNIGISITETGLCEDCGNIIY